MEELFAVAAHRSAAALALQIYADIFSQIQGAIIGFFQGIWNGVQAFFGQIFQAIANVIVAIFQAPINAINASWTNFTNSLAGFGPLAPLITAAMVGLVFVVAAFFIWLIAKLSVSETEQTAEEVEEGV